MHAVKRGKARLSQSPAKKPREGYKNDTGRSCQKARASPVAIWLSVEGDIWNKEVDDRSRSIKPG